jgi:hypothetical protein
MKKSRFKVEQIIRLPSDSSSAPRGHPEHPCRKLTATTAFTARDLHPGDNTHAGHIKKNSRYFKPGVFLYSN